MQEFRFQKAEFNQLDEVWGIIQGAILRRKNDGSQQWQDGYPNRDVILNDIETGQGFVLMNQSDILGYVALCFNNEPAYHDLNGTWLSEGDYIAVHRIAVAEAYIGKGIAKYILKNVETYCLNISVFSIKADTNFDNPAMISLFLKAGYSYCGEVFFRGASRQAYEKLLI